MPSRADWALLFIGLSGGPHATDQIRVMKGLFLFSQEGPSEVRRLYDFRPYDYGPFDIEIYRDLESLETDGLISVESIESTNRRLYRLTSKGATRLSELVVSAPPTAVSILRQIKQRVTSLSFLDLLRQVYDQYPAYAVRSVLTSK